MKKQPNAINQYYVDAVYSATNRHKFMTSFIYAGYSLIDKISPTESIIDIGCGQNLFKPYFPKLVGIDPATEEADLKISLQEFQTDQKFDVALCLGSIQGTDDDLNYQLNIIKNLLTDKGRIYWRCMPYPPPEAVPEWMQLWTFEKHHDMAQRFGFEVKDIAMDTRIPPGVYSPRIYAEWVRC